MGTMAARMAVTTPVMTPAKGMAGTPAGRGGGLLAEDAAAAAAAVAAVAATAVAATAAAAAAYCRGCCFFIVKIFFVCGGLEKLSECHH